MNTVPDSAAVTPLERAVLRSLQRTGAAHPDTLRLYAEHGHRFIGAAFRASPVYLARDAVRFFRHHEDDITARLVDCIQRRGATCADIFDDEWDSDDPLARGTDNQTTLARFGFADAARTILERMEQQA